MSLKVAYPSSAVPSSMSLLEPSQRNAHFGIGGMDSRQVIEECAVMRNSVMALNNRVRGPLDVENDRSTILPVVFFLGNHSSGKSSFINYLLHNSIQECGVAPTDDKFTVIVAGSANLEKDGNALIGDPAMGFTGLRKFGPTLINHTQLRVRSDVNIKDIMFIDTPGMIDSPDILGGNIDKAYDRGYNFEKVVKWYAARADVILLFFDPDKPGTTGETLSVLTNALSGMDHKLHIILNKVDQLEKIHDFARVYGSLCWNLSKVIRRKDLPPIYPMYLPPKYLGDGTLPKHSSSDALHPNAAPRPFFASALDDVKDQIVKEILAAPQKRMDNEIQRLSDSMTNLLMHCKIFNAMCLRYRELAGSFNGECFMSLLLCCGITSGTIAFELPRETTVAAGVASAATLGCMQYYRWRKLIQARRDIIQDRSVSDQIFKSVYALELLTGDDSVQALWPKVYDHMKIRVSPEDLSNATLVTDLELESINAILKNNVNRMRSLFSPQFTISREEQVDLDRFVGSGGDISVDSPVDGSSSIAGETNTTYYKLTALCADLETSIKAISTMSRDDTMAEIMRMRAEAFALPSPEAEYASRLFKVFNDMSMKNASENVSFAAEFPPALFEGHAEQIAGQAALKKNIFWFRVMVGVFGALCFLPLSTLTILAYPEITPVDVMTDECEVDIPGIYGFDKAFTLMPYQYVLAAGVLVFVHSVVVALFYLLPVDPQGRKYIPGLVNSPLRCCMSQENIAHFSERAGVFLLENTKVLELVVDSFLFVLMLVACLLASWALDAQVGFQGNDASYAVYESFSTFTSTFSNTSPACIEVNPVPIIRGSLAMAYLALLAFGFALQVSFRSYLQHRQHRSGYLFTIDDSQHSSISAATTGSVPSRGSSSAASQKSLSSMSTSGGRGSRTKGGNEDDVVTITL